MKNIVLTTSIILLSIGAYAQNVGINTTGAAPDASAMLDIDATNRGLLIPRVALTSTNAAGPIAAPTTSLLVYNNATAGITPNNVTPGYYYWNGTAWVRFLGAVDAWLTTGNTGTVAGTNFIGTNDAQAFVVKTGGSAATNERLRFSAGGLATYNNITPFVGDVFSVYGTGYAGTINALGNFSINGYVGAGGVGIYGESSSAGANNGIAIYGNLLGTSTATGTLSYGIFGDNFATPAGTGIAIGVGGNSWGTTGDARGVDGSTSSGAGIGTTGFNGSTTGFGYGIYGQSLSVAGTAILGINAAPTHTTNTSVGVFGRSLGTVTTGFNIGVRGYTDAVTGNGHAFYGQALSSTAIGGITFVTSSGSGWQGQNAGTGDGVRGFNTSATAATAGSGVYGQTGASTNFGGEFANTNAASGTGLYAAGNNVGGTYLIAGSGGAFNGSTVGSFSNATAATNGVGAYGISNGAGIFATAGGAGLAGSSTLFGVAGFSTSAANNTLRSGGYFETNAGESFAYVGARTAANVLRKIEGNGTVNTTVKDVNNNLVVLSCPEAPENLFQDYGVGKLIMGKAKISIDPTFAKNIVVNNEHPLRVFIQLEGECNGVYVTSKTQYGFEVIELANGNSNVDFSWTIVANRADEILSDGSISPYSSERFAPAMGPQKTITLETKAVDNSNNANMIQIPLDDVKDMKIPEATKTPEIKKKTIE
jgi:hypothetical protein